MIINLEMKYVQKQLHNILNIQIVKRNKVEMIKPIHALVFIYQKYIKILMSNKDIFFIINLLISYEKYKTPESCNTNI